MAISFDTSLLSAYYQARSGLGTSTSAGGSSGGKAPAPTPPWRTTTAPTTSELVRSVLAGGKFVNTNAAKLDVAGASEDYRKLFALYQGVTALQGLAEQVNATGVGPSEKARLSTRFNEGMKELGAYLDSASFQTFQLSQGTVTAKATGSVGVKRESDTYTTGALHTGAADTAVAAFQGNVAFSMTATLPSGSTKSVSFDLAEMGATTRTMSNVVIYLNSKLQAAGVTSRFENVRTPGAPKTVQAGGQSVTLGNEPDSYALKIRGVSTETLKFAAAAQGPAVYLAGASGSARQLTKYGTDPAAGATTAADGKVFAKTLSSEIQTVRQTVTGPDGSLYVLADVNGTTDGQTIKGSTDVALLKYDSAGSLVYTRTLGAANNASGFALGVSADGSRVAVAGSVTGALDLGDAGASPTSADSFLAVFDQEGQTVFSDRRGATADDQVNSLTFGADGSIYVAGTASSAMSGASAVGGQDAYVRGYAPAAAGAANPYTTKFTVQYGTTGVDKPAGVAVNGSTLVVAGVENGAAVLRRYDLQATGAPVLGTTRNLGAMQGGLAGVSFAADGSIVVAGNTTNGSLSAGSVTTAYGGGSSVFVAKLGGDLLAAGTDRLTYYGGGSRTASGVTLANGQAYVTGKIAVTPPPGQTTAFDGFATAIDPTTGAVGWTQQFRGADRQAAPSAIAVDTTGASALDRLGLPKGAIDWTGSSQLTAATSLRAGDQFSVRMGRGTAKTISIEAADTLKTVADKVNRALGFTAKVEVVIDKGYDRLRITPLNSRSPIELEAGKPGRDALEALGLDEGLIALTPDKAKKEKPNYALQLPSTLSIDSDSKAKQTVATLLGAITTLKTIYREATAPPQPKATASGPVPAYLTEQLANYQRALARLGG